MHLGRHVLWSVGLHTSHSSSPDSQTTGLRGAAMRPSNSIPSPASVQLAQKDDHLHKEVWAQVPGQGLPSQVTGQGLARKSYLPSKAPSCSCLAWEVGPGGGSYTSEPGSNGPAEPAQDAPGPSLQNWFCV